MKRFVVEDGKEKVFVQIKDLIFLERQIKTPEVVKKSLNFESTNPNKTNEYFEFDNPEIVKYLHDAYYILDYDKFNQMSDEQIGIEFDKNSRNIEKVKKEIKILRKKKISKSGFNDALLLLLHYENGIIQFMNERRLNSKRK